MGVSRTRNAPVTLDLCHSTSTPVLIKNRKVTIFGFIYGKTRYFREKYANFIFWCPNQDASDVDKKIESDDFRLYLRQNSPFPNLRHSTSTPALIKNQKVAIFGFIYGKTRFFSRKIREFDLLASKLRHSQFDKKIESDEISHYF